MFLLVFLYVFFGQKKGWGVGVEIVNNMKSGCVRIFDFPGFMYLQILGEGWNNICLMEVALQHIQLDEMHYRCSYLSFL